MRWRGGGGGASGQTWLQSQSNGEIRLGQPPHLLWPIFHNPTPSETCWRRPVALFKAWLAAPLERQMWTSNRISGNTPPERKPQPCPLPPPLLSSSVTAISLCCLYDWEGIVLTLWPESHSYSWDRHSCHNSLRQDWLRLGSPMMWKNSTGLSILSQ